MAYDDSGHHKQQRSASVDAALFEAGQKLALAAFVFVYATESDMPDYDRFKEALDAWVDAVTHR